MGQEVKHPNLCSPRSFLTVTASTVVGRRLQFSEKLRLPAGTGLKAVGSEIVRTQLDLVEYGHELCGRYSRVATQG